MDAAIFPVKPSPPLPPLSHIQIVSPGSKVQLVSEVILPMLRHDGVAAAFDGPVLKPIRIPAVTTRLSDLAIILRNICHAPNSRKRDASV